MPVQIMVQPKDDIMFIINPSHWLSVNVYKFEHFCALC